MELALIVVSVVAVLLLIYMNILATLCLFLDPDLSKIQRNGQLIFAWLIPYLGASVVIHLVSQHSPEVAKRLYIPWPFRSMVDDKPLRKKNYHGSAEEMPGIHSVGSSHSSGGSD